MYKLKALTVGLFCGSILLLASASTHASNEEGLINFNYQSGPNEFSSGILTYSLDFSEFTCSIYGGNVDCGEEPSLPPIRVTGLDYVANFSAAFSDLSFPLTTKTFTKDDLTNFSIYIDGVGNFLSTPSFVGSEINTNEVSLDIRIPLPTGDWLATVDFVNGQTIYKANNPIFPIPEPLTLLGASTAVAFGAGFKRRLKK